ncbi:organelle RRM domain-containing protein 6, chloroplastic [Chenopodium quinoa]|uniref:organelle RRM domain-containing protein 6, chloroplastic n=1 Tax=Chenopodium quinoa TaxID=63459 RepID=UPI000B77B0A5|nr:organelle RRM domain-containing protein 6, chloroplastic [Chenopodium quinoa]
MMLATGFLVAPCTITSQTKDAWKQRSPIKKYCSQLVSYCSSESCHSPNASLSSHVNNHGRAPSCHRYVMACVSSSSSSTPSTTTRLYVSGLSFRTTQESLRNAFQKFGQLVEVNLVMDKIANRPRGFAFLRYETEEESMNAIEGMHGKFLDGRVIFVEVAKPRSETGKNQQNTRESR